MTRMGLAVLVFCLGGLVTTQATKLASGQAPREGKESRPRPGNGSRRVNVGTGKLDGARPGWQSDPHRPARAQPEPVR